MDSTPSQRPWSVNGHSIEADDDRLWAYNDKTGNGVVANLLSAPKFRFTKKEREPWDAVTEANARLIVDAVNGRDRLLDLVRRLADNLERFHIVGERDRDLLREARAALKRKGKRP